MIAPLLRCAGRAFLGASDAVAAFDDALLGGRADAGGTPSGDGDISAEERERIRNSLWRLRRDLDELAASGFIESLAGVLDRAFGGPDRFVRVVRAWADLVDTLVQEAERGLGSAPGRGTLKKRQVKGALLYLVRRSRIDIAGMPAFLEPIVWDYGFDVVVDTVVRFANRNRLWVAAPASPTARARIGAQFLRLGGLFGWLGRRLTAVIWWLIARGAPVSPQLKAAINRFLLDNPDPLRSIVVLATWAVSRAPDLVAVSDLLSVVVVEANFVAGADPERRRAYARELFLAFLEDSVGVPDRGSLRYRLLVIFIETGIDVAVMLFEKHDPTYRQPPSEPAPP